MNDLDALVVRLSIMIAQLQQANEQLKAQLKSLRDQQAQEEPKDSDTPQSPEPRSKSNRVGH